MFSSIARRYLVTVAIISCVALSIGLLVEMRFAFQENYARVVALQRAEARAVAAKVQAYFSNLNQQISDVAGLPWGAVGFGENERRLEFARLLKLHPSVEEITAVQGGDILAFASRLSTSPEESTNRDAIAVTQRKPVGNLSMKWGSVFFKDDSAPYVWLATSVRGKPEQSIVISVSLRFLAEALAERNSDPLLSHYLVDGNNLLIAHSDSSLLLRHLDLTNHPPVTASIWHASTPSAL